MLTSDFRPPLRGGEPPAHRLGKRFWAHYGLDRDALLEALNYAYNNRVEDAAEGAA